MRFSPIKSDRSFRVMERCVIENSNTTFHRSEQQNKLIKTNLKEILKYLTSRVKKGTLFLCKTDFGTMLSRFSTVQRKESGSLVLPFIVLQAAIELRNMMTGKIDFLA